MLYGLQQSSPDSISQQKLGARLKGIPVESPPKRTYKSSKVEHNDDLNELNESSLGFRWLHFSGFPFDGKTLPGEDRRPRLGGCAGSCSVRDTQSLRGAGDAVAVKIS